LHVEFTFGWNSQGAGLIFLALVIPTFLGPLVGMLYDRHTSLPLYLAGFVLTLIFCPLLALIQSWSVGNDVLLVFILFMIGVGVSLVMVPGMAEISAFAENKEKDDPNLFGPRGATAQCCALMTIAMAAARVVGPIIIGAIQSASGWIATSITIGVFAALGIISLVLKTAYERTFVPVKN
jgi:MFS family permease